jgi:hypothetical protein
MIRSAIFLAAAVISTSLDAQTSTLGTAMATGQVGERYDGYLGTVTVPSEELRRQVAAINLRRRNLYIELGTRRGVTAQVVGLTAACELFAHLPAGEAYMLNDGAWRRAAGQAPPRPDQCR